MKRNVIFDFDGVIHEHRTKFESADIIPDKPIDGIKEAIKEIRKFYRVVVVSTRCYSPGGIEAIKEWLDKWGIAVDEVTDEKPPMLVSIDDRAICFDGNANSLLTKIQSFRTWQEQEITNCRCSKCGRSFKATKRNQTRI